MNLDIIDIQKKLGYKFKKWELLFQAFTHSSFANDNNEKSYERLEFLGDSILNFVVAKYLYHKYPLENEGFLSKVRAKIVSTRTLSAVLESMDVISYLKTSINGGGDNVRDSDAVKADLFEAIVGAIMLDGGWEEAEKFVLSKMEKPINSNFTAENITDFKSKFLEITAQKGDKAVFECKTTEKDNKNFYTINLKVGGKVRGKGEGFSKKRAEQLAAKKALAGLYKI